jgi:hypothetical protein
MIKLGVEDNEGVGCSSKRIRCYPQAEAGEENGDFARSLRSVSLASLKITETMIGCGALLSPLAATQFAQLPRWSFHYLVSMTLALSNVALLSIVLRFRSGDGRSL